MKEKTLSTQHEVLEQQSDAPLIVEGIGDMIDNLRGVICKWQNKEMEDRQAVLAGQMTEADYQEGLKVLIGFTQTSIDQLWAGIRRITNTTRPPQHKNISGFEEALTLLDNAAGWVDNNYKPPTFNLETGLLELNGQPISLESNEESVLNVLVRRRATSFRVLQNESKCRSPHKVIQRLQEKHPLLKRHVTMGVKRGGGGYSTTILPARETEATI